MNPNYFEQYINIKNITNAYKANFIFTYLKKIVKKYFFKFL